MSGTRASNDRPPGTGGVKRGRLQQEAAATGSRVTVVLGAQWGDEGKGKVVDLLATDADIVSRCQVRAPPASPLLRGPGTLSSLSSPPRPGHASWMPPLPGRPARTPPPAHAPLPRPGPGPPSPPAPPLGPRPGRSYKYLC